jgi:hypothetical protein
MIAPVTIHLNFHDDPGHGWLEVPTVLLDVLGLAQRISAYSYRSGDTVFLEEDCDAVLFHEAATEAGWDIIEVRVAHDGWADLRQFPRYRCATTNSRSSS